METLIEGTEQKGRKLDRQKHYWGALDRRIHCRRALNRRKHYRGDIGQKDTL